MNKSDPLASTLQDLRSGWIPPHIYSDAAIYEQECQRLFSRTWQFLAHESEVPNIGDYVVRRVLDDSFIVVRGEDGKVRALLNMCRHRGMQICRAEAGHAKRLVCPYHAWSYRTDGTLSGVPFIDDAYGGAAGLQRDELSLVQPATETFNGLVFVNLDPQAGSLLDYLGDFATYLAFYTQPSAAGVEVRGPQRWRFKANWKIGAENFAGDSYHTPHTHASIAEIGVLTQARASSRKGGAVYYAGSGAGATFKLGEGNFAERLASIGYPEPMIRSRAEHWPEAIRNVIGKDGFVPSAATLFPNLSMLHLWAKTDAAGTITPFTTLRLWQPVSAQETEMLSWFVVDKSASAEFKEASYKAYLMCFGSTGMFEQDDMENWALVTRMSRGQMSRSVHLHNRMGLAADGSALQPPLSDFSGPGVAHVGFSEHNQRQWMEIWCRHMEMEAPAVRSGPCAGGHQTIMMEVAR
jgi:phenylpropionate dioxygenase-like ring-hydroxylating dioxygenase large terminal subunit